MRRCLVLFRAFTDLCCSELSITNTKCGGWYFLFYFRSPLCHPLLCSTLWKYQWNCECHCELDTECCRQYWFLPHQYYHQQSTDPIWGTSEHQHCQCHTVWTDWFHERLWVQHHSAWCQLWESGGKAEWAPDNHSSRYVFCKGVSKSRNESKWKPHPQKDKFPASTSHRVYFLLC